MVPFAMFRRTPRRCGGLEETLGYRFHDPQLLQAALTHRSFRFENPEAGADNQRLEFLGDAVLGLLLADWVYHHFEEHSEGMLTILRSRIASTAALAQVARSLGIGPFLRLGHGEAAGGGHDRETSLADALEALLAALYLDAGLRRTDEVFRRIFAPHLDALDNDRWADNPKGHLQTLAQRDHQAAPVYCLLAEEGPPHARTFRVEVRVGPHLRAEGTGPSKQTAQVAAARALLAEISPRPAAVATDAAGTSPGAPAPE